jgi:hypothetical protein
MSIPPELTPGRWVEIANTGELAIIVERGPDDRIMVANGHGNRPCYHNVSASRVVLRPDCDGQAAPPWLQNARFSPRRPLHLDRVIDELTYRSYVWNRRRSPEVSVERWTEVFSNAERLEERYQRELAEGRS